MNPKLVILDLLGNTLKSLLIQSHILNYPRSAQTLLQDSAMDLPLYFLTANLTSLSMEVAILNERDQWHVLYTFASPS